MGGRLDRQHRLRPALIDELLHSDCLRAEIHARSALCVLLEPEHRLRDIPIAEHDPGNTSVNIFSVGASDEAAIEIPPVGSRTR
jgi:hypothetical protein